MFTHPQEASPLIVDVSPNNQPELYIFSVTCPGRSNPIHARSIFTNQRKKNLCSSHHQFTSHANHLNNLFLLIHKTLISFNSNALRANTRAHVTRKRLKFENIHELPESSTTSSSLCVSYPESAQGTTNDHPQTERQGAGTIYKHPADCIPRTLLPENPTNFHSKINDIKLHCNLALTRSS